jgi:hypothetical protein
MRAAAIGLLAAAVLVTAGCRQDMHDQPRYRTLAASTFFRDGRSARPVVEGTIARGQLKLDKAYYTGMAGAKPVDRFPMPVTRAVIERGRDRFNIYCTPCHGYLGYGNGMVVQRGFKAPPSYHQDQYREAPVGQFYDAITNGFGAMPSYASRIPVADRWAIIAYIRALQLSQNAKVTDVPMEDRKKLEETGR